jgi:hypothetical protein
MYYHVTAVRVLEPYKVWVRFEDGLEGEVDLSDLPGNGVFKRWADNPSEFFEARIDPKWGCVVWPGDLDLAPDAMYDDIARAAGRPSTSPG